MFHFYRKQRSQEGSGVRLQASKACLQWSTFFGKATPKYNNLPKLHHQPWIKYKRAYGELFSFKLLHLLYYVFSQKSMHNYKYSHLWTPLRANPIFLYGNSVLVNASKCIWIQCFLVARLPIVFASFLSKIAHSWFQSLLEACALLLSQGLLNC